MPWMNLSLTYLLTLHYGRTIKSTVNNYWFPINYTLPNFVKKKFKMETIFFSSISYSSFFWAYFFFLHKLKKQDINNKKKSLRNVKRVTKADWIFFFVNFSSLILSYIVFISRFPLILPIYIFNEVKSIPFSSTVF